MPVESANHPSTSGAVKMAKPPAKDRRALATLVCLGAMPTATASVSGNRFAIPRPATKSPMMLSGVSGDNQNRGKPTVVIARAISSSFVPGITRERRLPAKRLTTSATKKRPTVVAATLLLKRPTSLRKSALHTTTHHSIETQHTSAAQETQNARGKRRELLL